MTFGAPRDPAPAEPKENMLQAAHLEKIEKRFETARPCSRIEKGVETFSRGLEKGLEAPFENSETPLLKLPLKPLLKPPSRFW